MKIMDKKDKDYSAPFKIFEYGNEKADNKARNVSKIPKTKQDRWEIEHVEAEQVYKNRKN